MGSMAPCRSPGVSLGLPPPLSFGHLRSLTVHSVTDKRPPILCLHDTEEWRDAGCTLRARPHGPKSGVHFRWWSWLFAFRSGRRLFDRLLPMGRRRTRRTRRTVMHQTHQDAREMTTEHGAVRRRLLVPRQGEFAGRTGERACRTRLFVLRHCFLKMSTDEFVRRTEKLAMTTDELARRTDEESSSTDELARSTEQMSMPTEDFARRRRQE